MTEPSITHWQALLRLIRPHRRRYVLLAAMLAGASLLPLTGPLLIRAVIDRALVDGTGTTSILLPAIGYLVLAVGAQFVTVAVSYFATQTAWHTANGLRIQLTDHVLGLGHSFHRQHSPGELIQRVDGDVTAVSDFLGRVLLKTGGALFITVGMIGVLFVLDWRLGLFFLVYLLVAAKVVVRRRDRSISESVDQMGAQAALFGGIEERLTAAEDLRANGAGSHAMWRFVQDATTALLATKKMERAFLILWWTMQGMLTIGMVLALLGSAALLERDIISIGTAFVLFQYTLVLRRPLEEIVDHFDVVQKANGAMVRVVGLLALEPDVADMGTQRPAPGPLSVEFTDVMFDYGDDEPVLAGISLSVAAGDSVGIVGRSGSGKTTMSRLVVRLTEATSGSLKLGGIPIEDISRSELRHRVAIIPQDVQLLGGSVRDNVTLFDAAPTDTAVVDALTHVGLGHLESELHELIGEGGVGLSAGEAQLLALARVWLRKPDLIVLDEATSRVDPETEHRLQIAIAALLKGRTSLVIAHRLSTLRAVDRIVVVADGEIIEEGDRAQLAGDETSQFRRLLDLALETTS